MLVHLEAAGAYKSAATSGNAARTEVLHAVDATSAVDGTGEAAAPASRRMPRSSHPPRGRARPARAGPTCLFGATRGFNDEKEHSHKFMTLKGSSLGHSNDLSLFERKAMETQMFRKAQEAKARAKALTGLDWKNHVLEEPRAGSGLKCAELKLDLRTGGWITSPAWRTPWKRSCRRAQNPE